MCVLCACAHIRVLNSGVPVPPVCVRSEDHAPCWSLLPALVFHWLTVFFTVSCLCIPFLSKSTGVIDARITESGFCVFSEYSNSAFMVVWQACEPSPQPLGLFSNYLLLLQGPVCIWALLQFCTYECFACM